MTPVFFLKKLAEYIKTIAQNYQCPSADGTLKAINVYTQELPVKEESTLKYCPFILCRLTSGEDKSDHESIVKIRIIFGTIDEDLEQSWLTLVNALNHIRQALLKNRSVQMGERYYGRLILPMKYEIEGPQPHPLGYGFIDTEWNIPQMVEELIHYEDI